MAASTILRVALASKQFCRHRLAKSSLQLILSRRVFNYRGGDSNLPYKYTNSEAAKLSVSETLNIPVSNTNVENERLSFYKRLSVLLSFISFSIYFGILREENDIDEMLKSNPEYQNDYAVLADLHLKLAYCKQNNLPTESLQKKISEIKERVGIKDY